MFRVKFCLLRFSPVCYLLSVNVYGIERDRAVRSLHECGELTSSELAFCFIRPVHLAKVLSSLLTQVNSLEYLLKSCTIKIVYPFSKICKVYGF